MKKKIVVIVCALAFSLSSLAQNQVNYIIEGGYALMANFGPSPALRQPINGGQIDFSVDYRFASVPLLGLKSGLGYRFVGYYSTTNRLMDRGFSTKAHYDEYIRDHSVYWPVLLTINVDINEWTLRLLTGPRLCYHWSQMGYDGEENGYFAGMKGSLYINYLPLDCTWGAGIGVAYKHLYLETAYNVGLYDRTRPNRIINDLSSLVSRDFYFTVGYKF